MKKRTLPLAFIILILTALFFAAPYLFRSAAVSENIVKHSQNSSDNHENIIENYDIRTDKQQTETLLSFRQQSNKNSVEIGNLRNKFVAAENVLRQKVPTLKIEYNDDLRIPEIIAPDVKNGRAFLTSPSKTKHSDILLDFIQQNNDLLGLSNKQTFQLKLAADYTNPDGNLSFAQFNQTINDIPVFRGEVKAGFTQTRRDDSRYQQSRAGFGLSKSFRRFRRSGECR